MYSPRAESSKPPVLQPISDSFGWTTLVSDSAKGVLSATSTGMVEKTGRIDYGREGSINIWFLVAGNRSGAQVMIEVYVVMSQEKESVLSVGCSDEIALG